MLNESIKLTGRLSIKKYNKKKELVETKEVPNLIVTSGKEFIASRLVANTLDVMGYMSIGDDNSVPALGQTSLQNELARVASTESSSGVSATFDASFGPGVGTGSLVEAGIFNTSDSSVKTFDGDTDVTNSSDNIAIIGHGFQTGDLVTYTDGGSATITGLTDGGTFYVIRIDDDNLKLATSETNANAGTAIDITGTSGATHKLSYGSMLCRTTFPVINKGATETVAISWVITVG